MEGVELLLAESFYRIGNFEGAKQLYLKHLNSGETIIANDLGRLYLAEGDKDNAEKYFLVACESGITISASNLAYMYYQTNRNYQIATEILQTTDIRSATNLKIRLTRTLVALWGGQMSEFTALFEPLWNHMAVNSPQILSTLIMELLIHKQYQLLSNKFEVAEGSKKLRKKFLPLYYTLTCITDGDKESSQTMPPEIQEVVNNIVTHVKERQEFYYGKPS
jgi:tetratricopeptide (TPR) repeat protein